MNLLICVLLMQVAPFTVESKKATPELLRTFDHLDRIRLEAFDHAVKQLAAKVPDDCHVLLEAVDAADPDPARFKPHSGLSAMTWSESDTVVKIRFHMEYLVNGLCRPEITFRHEMVHALMRLDLGREKYGNVPRWMREGIAVHLAGQLQEKLWHGMMQPRIAANPELLFDGLKDKDHNLTDYYEDAMAIVYLAERPMPRSIFVLTDLVRWHVGSPAGKALEDQRSGNHAMATSSRYDPSSMRSRFLSRPSSTNPNFR